MFYQLLNRNSENNHRKLHTVQCSELKLYMRQVCKKNSFAALLWGLRNQTPRLRKFNTR